MVVFVVPGAPEVSLGPEVAAGLAALGINRVTLLRDPDGVAVVVEGWAFDESSAPDAIAALGVGGAARTMMMVAETSISRDPLRAASLSADTGG